MDDGEPSWCCPACKVVYAKAGAPPPKIRRDTRKIVLPGDKFTGTRGQWLAVIGIVAVAGAVVWLSIAANAQQDRVDALRAAEASAAREKSAKVYATYNYQDGVQKLRSLMRAWATQVDLASATPRMFLAPRIEEMDGVIGKMADMHIREACLEQARVMLVDAAQERRDAFMAFAKNRGSDSFKKDLSAGDAERDVASQLAKCSPPQSPEVDP